MRTLFKILIASFLLSGNAFSYDPCQDPDHQEDSDCMQWCLREFNSCVYHCSGDRACIKQCIKERAECEVDECDHCP